MSRETEDIEDPKPIKSGLKGRIKFVRSNYDKKADTVQPIERARFWVTIIVAGTYGASIIALIIIAAVNLFCYHKDITSVLELGDLLQKLLLPIVTLVLGFYYGTNKN